MFCVLMPLQGEETRTKSNGDNLLLRLPVTRWQHCPMRKCCYCFVLNVKMELVRTGRSLTDSVPPWHLMTKWNLGVFDNEETWGNGEVPYLVDQVSCCVHSFKLNVDPWGQLKSDAHKRFHSDVFCTSPQVLISCVRRVFLPAYSVFYSNWVSNSCYSALLQPLKVVQGQINRN